ncbi:MAG: ribonuclease P protein component [Candidatus Thiodiazotropha sp. (ex Dulcina madagascariensis)]|nr:ribonuclease P protein component [Candidatus Thiodiazotropha sp. (ex Dulcina madagascariensis)]
MNKRSLPRPEEAFPPSRRLLKPDEYRRVFDNGRRSVDKQFLVLGRPNHLDCARLGLAVSKKNCRLAVDRNRIKRLIRESFRQNQALLKGLDLVVVARKGAATAENRRCSHSLGLHWRKMVELCVA